MEELFYCPVCDSTDFASHLICRDYTVSEKSFSLVKCKFCSFVFTNPRPNPDEIGQYYESVDYVSHSDTSQGLINNIYQKVKSVTIRQKANLVFGLTAKREILDIGCGTGSFLGQCKAEGWSVRGVEPNVTARDNCFLKFGFTPESSFVYDNYAEGSLSVITLWHVLEHVHELNHYLSSFNKLLSEDGFLVIAVPNHTSYDANYYKEFWAAYDVPRHLWHFSPETIKKLCSNFGFALTEIKPMWFDSFYVSMLSEKYKSGGNIFNAFLVGFVSNLKALSKSGTCSSQIYVFSKKGP